MDSDSTMGPLLTALTHFHRHLSRQIAIGKGSSLFLFWDLSFGISVEQLTVTKEKAEHTEFLQNSPEAKLQVSRSPGGLQQHLPGSSWGVGQQPRTSLASDNFLYSFSSLLGTSCDCLAFTSFDVYLMFDVFLMRLLANKAAWRFRKHFKVALENCLVVFSNLNNTILSECPMLHVCYFHKIKAKVE